jgi:hypothetical protein
MIAAPDGKENQMAAKFKIFDPNVGDVLVDSTRVAAILAEGGGGTTYATATEVTAAVTQAKTEYLWFAVGDETTDITAGAAKLTFRMPFAMTLTAVRASLSTASASGGPFTVDIKDGGTTVLSTKLTIEDTEKTSTTATAAAVISDPALADDAEITIDVDDEGAGAKGLKVMLGGTRA